MPLPPSGQSDLETSLRLGETLRRWIVRPLLNPIVCRTFALRQLGTPPEPRQPAVIAANHASHFEPLLIPWLLPGNVHTLAMAELFHGPLRRRFWHLMLAIPVDRRRLEPRAVCDALRRLRAGRQILLFPEGGIRFGHQAVVHRKAPLAIGAAGLAVLAQVPLYPLVLTGTRAGYQCRAWIRGHAPIGVFFGQPLDTTPLAGERRSDTVSRVNATLLDALNELVRCARSEAAPAARPLARSISPSMRQ